MQYIDRIGTYIPKSEVEWSSQMLNLLSYVEFIKEVKLFQIIFIFKKKSKK